MLTQEDLKNIGVELGKVIEQNVTPALEQMATKEDLKRVEEKMNGRFDSIESRLSQMESDIADIRQRLDTLSWRTKEDDDALIKDIFALRKRIDALETEVKQMKLKVS